MYVIVTPIDVPRDTHFHITPYLAARHPFRNNTAFYPRA
jgi:hypothetical protein